MPYLMSSFSLAQYLGKLLNKTAKGEVEVDAGFRYKHLGSFAYIGSENAVAEFAGELFF